MGIDWVVVKDWVGELIQSFTTPTSMEYVFLIKHPSSSTKLIFFGLEKLEFPSYLYLT